MEQRQAARTLRAPMHAFSSARVHVTPDLLRSIFEWLAPHHMSEQNELEKDSNPLRYLVRPDAAFNPARQENGGDAAAEKAL